MPDFNSIPASACCFVAEVEFGDNGDNAKTVPIRLLARSLEPIEHWFWGRVVHDMAGVRHKARIPLDYVHGEEIGYANKFDVTPEGLEVRGALVPTNDPTDPAPKVIARARGGVPYEASINFGGDGIRYEQVGEGQVTTVNGYEFEGPGVVIRNWPLRGVAVCPYGADANTESRFNQAETFSAQPIETKTMPEETTPPVEATAEPAAVETPAEVNTPVEAPAEPAAVETEAPAAEPVGELSQGHKEAARYREAFGDQGAVWFAEGVPFPDCYARKVASLEAKVAELTQRLSAPKAEGEAEPVTFTAGDEAPKRKLFGLRFAK
jgi:hypothetical protein